MSRIHLEDFPGATAPVLSATLLARIHELNLDYLELLAAEHTTAAGCGQLQHLPSRLHAAVAALTTSERSALAAMPYTLYSLGFEDAAFWRSISEPDVLSMQPTVEERYVLTRDVRRADVFCEVALLYAWHVASSNRLASRVVYAMPDATAQLLVAAPLWRLKRIAGEHPALLMPRWPTNPGFWPDLVRFAASADAQRLATAKVLGHQLIAAELEFAARRGGAARTVSAPAAQSPRLRARRLQTELRVQRLRESLLRSNGDANGSG